MEMKPNLNRVALMFLVTAALVVTVLVPITTPVYAHDDITMKPGDTYDLSKVKKATELYIKSGGSYTLTGKSSKVTVYVEAKKNQTINVHLDGITLTPNSGAPGVSWADRSAITIEDSKEFCGTVQLISKEDTISTLTGYNESPAIRKDGTRSRLVFLTDYAYRPGTIIAKADKGANKMCAIGSKGNFTSAIRSEVGNIEFKLGNIEAYGSSPYFDLYGGPAIGAGHYDNVKGLTFSGANVKAVSGSSKAAAIGTGSAWAMLYLWAIQEQHCDDVTISAGTIEATVGKNDSTEGGGAAAIGGGDACSAHNIKISDNATVSFLSTKVTANGKGFGSTGIGGGMNGNGENIVIEGGTVEASGYSTGIGGGYSTGELDPTDPDNPFYKLTAPEGGKLGSKIDNVYGNGIVKISGGKVTARANGNGVGIGGWKIDGTSSVDITGGDVEAYGKSRGAGIGAGQLGMIDHINITGGDVKAYGGEEAPGIGSGINDRTADSAHSTGYINISGGRVYAEGGDKAKQVDIGGHAEVNLVAQVKKNTPVYISGGNVKTAHWNKVTSDSSRGIYKGMQRQSKKSSGKLSLHRIVMQTHWWGQSGSTQAKVTSLKNKNNTNYRTNDMRLFEEYNEKEDYDLGVLYMWLPENENAKSAAFDQKMIGRQYKNDVMYGESSGMDMDKEGDGTSEFYPATEVTLKANTSENGGASKDGRVFAAYKTGSLSDMKDAERTGYHVIKYTSGEDEKSATVIKDGKLVKGVDGFTDSDGNWVQVSDRHFESELYAQWEPNSYSVEFDSNIPTNASTKDKASGEMDIQEDFTYGTPKALSPNKFKLPGYEFAGWNTASDGTGKKYSDKQNVDDLAGNDNETVTLYAQWTPMKYKVSFDGGEDNVTGSMAEQEMEFDKNETLNENSFSREGSYFSGWTRSDSGFGGKTYPDKAVVTNACTVKEDGSLEGVKFTANWIESSDIIVAVYNDGEGVSGLEDKIVLTGSSAGAEEIEGFQQTSTAGIYELQDSGITGGSWSVSVEGYDTSGKSIEVNGGTGMIALHYYTVTIDAGDKHVKPYIGTKDVKEKQKVPQGAKVSINTEVDTGYLFESYTSDGNAAVWEDNDPTIADQAVTINERTFIGAHSKPVKYTVRFDVNDEKDSKEDEIPSIAKRTGSMEDQDMVYDQLQTLYKNKYSINGYVFTGWNTESDGSGTEYGDEEQLKENLSSVDGKEVVLYAQWKRTAAHFNLAGTVDLVGRDMVDGEKFSFMLTADSATLNPIRNEYIYMPESAETYAEKKEENAQPVGFEFGRMIFNKEGEYKFIVEQLDPGLPGVVVDTDPGVTADTDKEVTINVTENSDGTLTAKQDKLEFVNEYRGSVTPELYASVGLKAVSDDTDKSFLKSIEMGRFSFDFRNTEGDEDISAEGLNFASDVGETAHVEFRPLNFATMDAQDCYTIGELVSSGAAEKVYEDGVETYNISMLLKQTSEDKDGVTVDDRQIPVTLKLKMNPYSTTLGYEIIADDAIEYVNTYRTNNVVISVKAKKTMKGSREVKQGEFEAGIKGNGPMPEAVKARNGADGYFDFGNITYRVTDLEGADQKTFTYSIKEEASNIKDVKDDTESKKFTVTVKDDGKGNLSAETKGSDSIEIVNVYREHNAATGDQSGNLIVFLIILMTAAALAGVAVLLRKRR